MKIKILADIKEDTPIKHITYMLKDPDKLTDLLINDNMVAYLTNDKIQLSLLSTALTDQSILSSDVIDINVYPKFTFRTLKIYPSFGSFYEDGDLFLLQIIEVFIKNVGELHIN